MKEARKGFNDNCSTTGKENELKREELLIKNVAKPILFNTEMVKAILEGRKTVTRRICKDGNNYTVPDMGYYDADKRTYAVHNYADAEYTEKLSIAERKCPICPGDILYVRESVFQGVGHYLDVSGETVSVLTHDFEYYADGLHEKGHWKDKHERTWMHRRPSIHMPKEAARIFLKVKDVRVERLQEITEEQALAEGVPDDWPMDAVYCPRCHGYGLVGALSENLGFMEVDCKACEKAVTRFKNLWNSTIKKSDLEFYGWDANPWVWVIEFERIEY